MSRPKLIDRGPTFNIVMTNKLLERLNKRAIELGKTKTWVIRDLLDHYLPHPSK
jgi:predicted DNA-binding protein